MEVDINKIQIGKIGSLLSAPQWISDWSVTVKPEQSASIPQTNDGTRHWSNVEEWLRPEIRFTYNFRNAQQYAEASQIIILGAFVCRHFIPEINMWFTGLYKLTDSSREFFVRLAGNKYGGVVGFSFMAQSIYTYDNFQQLIDKANG